MQETFRTCPHLYPRDDVSPNSITSSLGQRKGSHQKWSWLNTFWNFFFWQADTQEHHKKGYTWVSKIMSRFEFFYQRAMNRISLFKTSIWITYQYLTAMALVTDHCLIEYGLVANQFLTCLTLPWSIVADQSLTAIVHRLEFNSSCKPQIVILARNWLIRS